MSIIDDILKTIGLTGSKKGRTILPSLPNPSEIKEGLEKVVEGITEAKGIPKELMKRVKEADEDFRDIDKSLRGTKVRGKKR